MVQMWNTGPLWVYLQASGSLATVQLLVETLARATSRSSYYDQWIVMQPQDQLLISDQQGGNAVVISGALLPQPPA